MPRWGCTPHCEYGIISEEQLNEFEINGSVLQVHPTKHPEYGIDFSGGSLAQGLSFATGLALGRRLKGETWQTYVLVGDGECNEGQSGSAPLWPRTTTLIT